MLLEYIPTEEWDAEILKNALLRCKFEFHDDDPFLVERECWEMVRRKFSLICPWIKLWIKIKLYSHNNL